jgi:hypothetical protein
MKLLTAVAVIALTTATAAYAQSGNSATTNSISSNQGQQIQNNSMPPATSASPKMKSSSMNHGATAASNGNAKTGQTAAMKGSRSPQDQNANQITAELNRQQLQTAQNMNNGSSPPQIATKPSDMPPAQPPLSQPPYQQ